MGETTGVLLFLALMVASLVWRGIRGAKLLDEWASANGFELIATQLQVIPLGPYFFRTSKGQQVYYVTVKDSNGNQRSGYVRLGSWLFGLLSHELDVTWDS